MAEDQPHLRAMLPSIKPACLVKQNGRDTDMIIRFQKCLSFATLLCANGCIMIDRRMVMSHFVVMKVFNDFCDAFEDSFIQPRRVMNGKMSLDLIRRTHHGVTIMLDHGQRLLKCSQGVDAI
ncbi:hypothetical protein SCA6_015002 [Theobroma cacao]